MSDPTSEAQLAPTSEGHDLAVERCIDAAPDAVFDAFVELYGDTRPDWILDSRIDFRVGGRWTVTFHPPGNEPFREERVITALKRPGLLAYSMTLIPSGRGLAFGTDVALEFSEQGASTRVRLTQRGFPAAAIRDQFANAWPDVLELLERRLCGRDSG